METLTNSGHNVAFQNTVWTLCFMPPQWAVIQENSGRHTSNEILSVSWINRPVPASVSDIACQTMKTNHAC